MTGICVSQYWFVSYTGVYQVAAPLSAFSEGMLYVRQTADPQPFNECGSYSA